MSKKITTLDAKLHYLYRRPGGASVRFDLETTQALLRELEVDVGRLACVHVAGTNGKGSVAAMLDAALRAAGVRSALYTSPHLLRFNERIRVGGEMIPNEDLLRLLNVVERADERQVAGGGRAGTFFELTTALALLWFLEQQVQLVVLETGMGGRLDSTNVVTPLLTVLTEIGLEHREHLGDTLEKIAREKAGIIKPGRPVIMAPQAPAVRELIEGTARQLGARLLQADEQVSVRRISQSLAGQVLAVETGAGPWPRFRLPLLGDFQLENCALAVSALEWLRDEAGLGLTPESMSAGLAETYWPARCQVVLQDPVFIVDVGHNPDAARAVGGFLKQFQDGRPVVLVCGMLADKDAVSFFRLLQPVVRACVLVPIDSERSMPMERLMAAAQAARLPAVENSLVEGVRNARAWAQKNNGIAVAMGSLYLAAAVLHELGVNV